MFGIKNIIIAAAVSLLVGIGTGWYIGAEIAGAAALRKEVAGLKLQLKARDIAAKLDADQFAANQQQIDDLQRKIEDAEKNTSDGKCLEPSDTDRLRNLWK